MIMIMIKSKALIVACQPAADVGVAVAVAFQTESHFKIPADYPVHGLDPAVAGLAINLFSYVALVIKKHMLGHVIDLAPGRGRIGVKILMLLFYFRVIGDDMVMAEQAFFHRRHPGIRRAFYIGMTETAVNGLVPGMNPVGKGNGLLNAGCCMRVDKN